MPTVQMCVCDEQQFLKPVLRTEHLSWSYQELDSHSEVQPLAALVGGTAVVDTWIGKIK